MPRPITVHLTDQQRHARAGRAQAPLPQREAGDQARHRQTRNGHQVLAESAAANSTRNDVFDDKGRFLKSEPGNRTFGYSTIFVRTSPAHQLKLSEAFHLLGSRDRLLLLREITVHYATQLTIAGRVGAGRTRESTALSFYNPDTKTIAIAYAGSGLDPVMNNIYAFKSSLEHEKRHAQNDRGVQKILDQVGVPHADVFMAQMQTADFKAAPLAFRERVAAAMITVLFRDQNMTPAAAQDYLNRHHAVLRNAGLRIRMQDSFGVPQYQLNTRPFTPVPL